VDEKTINSASMKVALRYVVVVAREMGLHPLNAICIYVLQEDGSDIQFLTKITCRLKYLLRDIPFDWNIMRTITYHPVQIVEKCAKCVKKRMM